MQDHIHTPVDIAPIIKEALKLLEASLPANIQFNQKITTRKQILADPTQIHQVIMNLCTNAFYAKEETGGQLSVSLTHIPQHETLPAHQADLPPNDYLRLTVADTGSGIKPSVLGNIFDPYFSTKGKDKGAGLSLAVVHGIVKSHGGDITVKSNIGVGTVVNVFFPTTDDATIAEEGHPKQLPGGTEKILLVDDG